nr:SPFH domain-containing protein [Angustibacter aerolatus]
MSHVSAPPPPESPFFVPQPRPRRRMGRGRLALVVLVLLAIVAVVTTSVVLGTGFDRTAGGEVAVVRDGGPFDDNQVRQVLQPASQRTWTGLFSTSHTYPAQQRFYTITSVAGRGERTGVDVENDPTADGVEVGIEGTIYFTLTSDAQALKAFDDKYGTRRYQGPTGSTGTRGVTRPAGPPSSTRSCGP